MKNEPEKNTAHAGREGRPLPLRLAAAAALCALLLLLFWLLWGRGAGVNIWGEDTPYPYTWTVKRDGTVLLSLKNDAESGCVWLAQDYSESLLAVQRQGEDEPGAKNTSFLLSPVSQGITRITFLYQDPQEEREQRFLWEIPVRVDGEGKLSLDLGMPQELGAVQEGERTEHCTLTWTNGRDGQLFLLLKSETDLPYAWATEYDKTLLSVSAPIHSEEGCTITVQGTGGGETTLSLTGAAIEGAAPTIRYVLSLQVNGQSVTVTENHGEELP